MDDLFSCANCGKGLPDNVPILVDSDDLPPLDFCSWKCLMEYTIKKYNKDCEENNENPTEEMRFEK